MVNRAFRWCHGQPRRVAGRVLRAADQACAKDPVPVGADMFRYQRSLVR
jgi:hypothetical protein